MRFGGGGESEFLQNYRFGLLLFFFCRTTSSSSDSESDEDYVPSSKELKDDDAASVDEDNSEDSSHSEGEAEGGVKRTRRNERKSGRKKRKSKSNQDSVAKSSNKEDEDEDDDDDESPSTTKKQEPSRNIDEIWNTFKKDVESTEKKQLTKTNDDAESSKEPSEPKEPPKTKKVTELFEFAGEAVEVEKEVPIDAPEPAAKPQPSKNIPATSVPGPRRNVGGGLSSILGQIGKKNKLSILEKSKLDWNSFKKQEGIEEQLQTHNKGKDGFLEKQDFLQRTDLRRFEIEKAMRTSSRRSK